MNRVKFVSTWAQRLNMKQKKMLLDSWQPQVSLKDKSSVEIHAMFVQLMLNRQDLIDDLHELQPEYFAMPYYVLQDVFDKLPNLAQVEYLARQGRVAILKRTPSKSDPNLTVCHYDPFDIDKLTDDDFQVPAIPDMLTKDAIRQHFGWSKSMVDKYLSEPIRSVNPYCKSSPMRKRWYAGDIEALQAENPDVRADLERLEAKRKKAG